MKTTKPQANTPNKLAKLVLADVLDAAFYIGDNVDYQPDGSVKGYVAGIEIEMSEQEWSELNRFICKHVDRVSKFLGQG